MNSFFNHLSSDISEENVNEDNETQTDVESNLKNEEQDEVVSCDSRG